MFLTPRAPNSKRCELAGCSPTGSPPADHEASPGAGGSGVDRIELPDREATAPPLLALDAPADEVDALRQHGLSGLRGRPPRRSAHLHMVVECKKKKRTDGHRQLALYLTTSHDELRAWLNGDETCICANDTSMARSTSTRSRRCRARAARQGHRPLPPQGLARHPGTASGFSRSPQPPRRAPHVARRRSAPGGWARSLPRAVRDRSRLDAPSRRRPPLEQC
jgi:hypothetical protein